jgi:hypothetical protein
MMRRTNLQQQQVLVVLASLAGGHQLGNCQVPGQQARCTRSGALKLHRPSAAWVVLPHLEVASLGECHRPDHRLTGQQRQHPRLASLGVGTYPHHVWRGWMMTTMAGSTQGRACGMLSHQLMLMMCSWLSMTHQRMMTKGTTVRVVIASCACIEDGRGSSSCPIDCPGLPAPCGGHAGSKQGKHCTTAGSTVDREI